MLELEEVIVTAQKRAERLQDVPVPVSAISGEALASNNQLRLEDYYNQVPGLGLAVIGDSSAPTVTIRGITTGGLTNPTVGIVVDEMPYGATIAAGAAVSAPDIDPGDLSRVEVLRGPQGTLYGASSIGGLLKFVTVDPSTQAFDGRLQAGLASVKDGEVGHTLRGSVNVPLSDTFAVRASGFTLRDPGYVDNVQTGTDDINRRNSDGGRLSAMWQPSEDFSLKLSALVQNSERQGTSDVDITLGSGEPRQNALRATGLYGRDTEAYSLKMDAKLGSADLTSVSGYSTDTIDSRVDQTVPFFSGVALSNFGVAGVAGPLHRTIDKFTQEVRASFPIAAKLQWLIGAFYTDEDVLVDLDYLAVDPATAAEVGTIFSNDQPTTFKEHAAFTNLTYHFSDRFDIQLGGRYSENEQSFSGVRTGPLTPLIGLGPSPSLVPEVEGEDDAFTFLLTPRWKISPDLMVYARIASGYRPGGPNAGCGIVGVPCQYAADTTQNYEIGFKGDAFGGALSFDASLYSIDWKDIQIPLTLGVVSFIDNGSRAKSQGAELAVESNPLAGLTVAAWVVYNEAELTEDLPTVTASSAVGRPGDRLPYSSRFSGSLGLDQEFPLGSRATGFLGGSVSYVGERKGLFRRAGLVREIFPDYTQVDLRAGLRYDNWTAQAFVNNLTDERGILRSGLDSNRPTYLTFIQPRTIGLSLIKDF